MQMAVIEAARNLLNLKDANSTEFDKTAKSCYTYNGRAKEGYE